MSASDKTLRQRSGYALAVAGDIALRASRRLATAGGPSLEGDLTAMTVLREALAPAGRMILTIPVGRDMVCPPLHRIYGEQRLPRLLDGFTVVEQQFWHKHDGRWRQVARSSALATAGGEA